MVIGGVSGPHFWKTTLTESFSQEREGGLRLYTRAFIYAPNRDHGECGKGSYTKKGRTRFYGEIFGNSSLSGSSHLRAFANGQRNPWWKPGVSSYRPYPVDGVQRDTTHTSQAQISCISFLGYLAKHISLLLLIVNLAKFTILPYYLGLDSRPSGF
jgi:hypothetical protein